MTGDVLRAAREAAGLTQVQLAQRAGIDPITISRIERGVVEPNPATVRVLEIALAGAVREEK